jgi:release factor glutamine methyltransferase
MPAITVTEHIEKAVRKIDKSKAIDHWDRNLGRYDAEELMTEVLGRKLTPAILDRLLDGASKKRYAAMVARRVNGEPIPRIKGHYAFRGLDLLIRDGVFVPRASSELLADEAIKALRRRRGQRVAVDVATGAGPVALAVASEVRGAEVWGVDISVEAALLGKDNARHLGLRNVHFRAGDLLDALPRRLRGEIDVFTIHPPYVLRGDLKELPREIRAFEPLQSLTDGSDDGLGLVRRLAAESHEWLRPGGVLLVEVGTYLSRRTQATLRAARLVDVDWAKDDLGVTRVVSGRTPKAKHPATR